MSNRVIDAIRQAREDYHRLKGGSGSGNFGHAGRPGKRGGSAAGKGGGASGGNEAIPLGGKDKPHAKGYSIKFEDAPGYHRLSAETDKAIENKLAKLEEALGRKLSRDYRTGFPNFTMYADGEETGGG